MALLIDRKGVLEDRLQRDERHRGLRTSGLRASLGCFAQYHANYPRCKRLVQHSSWKVLSHSPSPPRSVHRSTARGSCTCPMRINIAGSPDDCHRSKKAWTRGLAWHPGSPFTSGDALTAGRADTLTPRQLTATRRSLPCSLFLTPALA